MSANRMVIGVFTDAESLQAAIDESRAAGFDRSDIALLAGERTVEEHLGHVYRRVESLEDDFGIPLATYVPTAGDTEPSEIEGLTCVGVAPFAGAVFLSGGGRGGALAAALGRGPSSGMSGLIASVLAPLMGRHEANRLQREIDGGGLLLLVCTRDDAREIRAREILTRHAGRHVHISELAAA